MPETFFGEQTYFDLNANTFGLWFCSGVYFILYKKLFLLALFFYVYIYFNDLKLN
jgi:hypothetical protein